MLHPKSLFRLNWFLPPLFQLQVTFLDIQLQTLSYSSWFYHEWIFSIHTCYIPSHPSILISHYQYHFNYKIYCGWSFVNSVIIVTSYFSPISSFSYTHPHFQLQISFVYNHLWTLWHLLLVSSLLEFHLLMIVTSQVILLSKFCSNGPFQLQVPFLY